MRSEEFFKRVISRLDLDISYYAEGEVLRNERFRNSPYEVTYANVDPLFFDRPIYIDFSSDSTGEITLPQRGGERLAFVVGDDVHARQLKKHRESDDGAKKYRKR